MSEIRDKNLALLQKRRADDPQIPTPEEEKSGEQELATSDLKTQDQVDALEKAAKSAKSKQIKDKLRERAKAEKERIALEEKQKKEQALTLTKTQQAYGIVANAGQSFNDAATRQWNKVVNLGKNATDTIAQVTTPGGMMLPITLLLLFFFIILPINGKTRINWLFLAMTGQAQIGGQIAETDNTGISSGDFPASLTGPTSLSPSLYVPAATGGIRYL